MSREKEERESGPRRDGYTPEVRQTELKVQFPTRQVLTHDFTATGLHFLFCTRGKIGDLSCPLNKILITKKPTN